MNLALYVVASSLVVGLVSKSAHCSEGTPNEVKAREERRVPPTFYVQEGMSLRTLPRDGFASFRVSSGTCVVLPLQLDGSRELLCVDGKGAMTSALAMCEFGNARDVSSPIQVE